MQRAVAIAAGQLARVLQPCELSAGAAGRLQPAAVGGGVRVRHTAWGTRRWRQAAAELCLRPLDMVSITVLQYSIRSVFGFHHRHSVLMMMRGACS
jgi:hypothetical protein